MIDAQWKDHLTAIEHHKDGIGLRGYAQINPLNEYKREAFEMFEALNARIESESIQYLYRLEIGTEGLQAEEREQELVFAHPSGEGFGGGGASEGGLETATATPVRRETPKIGRNQPCTCGSGKKYKHCCGR